ncbi:MAG: hypothetical protein JWN59_164 [Sphingomonas bacterium]|jgi:hypothetical protein|nr:hypothetical protein [Sphingomonas bacterium]
MASHEAIAAVSRTLQTLLRDRMVTPVAVTLAPPDVTVADVDGPRLNLYLIQLIENAGLKNQEIPGFQHSGTFGHPPLSLNLRYLLTTHSAIEAQRDADLNAQTLLGDAMRVFNDFGSAIDRLAITNAAAGPIGDPVLDPVLADEFERLRLVLHPASIDDITKLWSAVSGTNFRRSVIYEVTVVQIATPTARVRPQPVQTRRINMTVRRRPTVLDAYVTPAPNGPIGEIRARIGDDITILTQGALAGRVFVRLGELEPIRVTPSASGEIRLIVPDADYPIDLDHPATRPIPLAVQLQPGSVPVRVVIELPAEGVEGGLGRGTAVAGTRRHTSNSTLLQLCPAISAISPTAGNAGTVLRVTGTRLWHGPSGRAEVIVGDAAIGLVDPPPPGVAAPTPTAVEVPLAVAADLLDISPIGYPVAVQVDGARSRDPGFDFVVGP